MYCHKKDHVACRSIPGMHWWHCGDRDAKVFFFVVASLRRCFLAWRLNHHQSLTRPTLPPFNAQAGQGNLPYNIGGAMSGRHGMMDDSDPKWGATIWNPRNAQKSQGIKNCWWFFPILSYHPCNIYLHLVNFYGKCTQIYHTWMVYSKGAAWTKMIPEIKGFFEFVAPRSPTIYENRWKGMTPDSFSFPSIFKLLTDIQVDPPNTWWGLVF